MRRAVLLIALTMCNRMFVSETYDAAGNTLVARYEGRPFRIADAVARPDETKQRRDAGYWLVQISDEPMGCSRLTGKHSMAFPVLWRRGPTNIEDAQLGMSWSERDVGTHGTMIARDVSIELLDTPTPGAMVHLRLHASTNGGKDTADGDVAVRQCP